VSERPPLSPAAAGFSMPAEWEPHAGCLMAWPTRRELWGRHFEAAKADYAATARAVGEFEPVVMVCLPGATREVRGLCGSAVTPVEIPIDDSWIRDSGPAFVRNADGDLAVTSFRFNAWGGRWHPHDADDRLAGALGDRFGLPVFQAPFVLEGGAFFVDGQGTVITTEQCLLNPNRNPSLTREQIEQGLRDYLGATTVIWLPFGHSHDTGPAGTDGHVDGVAQYVAPARVVLEVPSDRASSEFERARANLAVLESARDARARSFEVLTIDPGVDATVSYANHYLANGGVIVPVGGDETDARALDTLARIYPDRAVVGVPGTVIAFGGGGPHCITQQIPSGVRLP